MFLLISISLYNYLLISHSFHYVNNEEYVRFESNLEKSIKRLFNAYPYLIITWSEYQISETGSAVSFQLLYHSNVKGYISNVNLLHLN